MICLLLCVFCNKKLYKFKKVDLNDGINPFLVLKNEEGTFKFYEDELIPSNIASQCHTPFLIQAVSNIKKPICYYTSKKAYFIYPFDKIIMVDDDVEICLGIYNCSYIIEETYWQEYHCGDVCDLNRSITRFTMVSFKGMNGKLRVEEFEEKNLCEYVFKVGGEEFFNKINSLCEIKYRYKKDGEINDELSGKENKETVKDEEINDLTKNLNKDENRKEKLFNTENKEVVEDPEIKIEEISEQVNDKEIKDLIKNEYTNEKLNENENKELVNEDETRKSDKINEQLIYEENNKLVEGKEITDENMKDQLNLEENKETLEDEVLKSIRKITIRNELY